MTVELWRERLEEEGGFKKELFVFYLENYWHNFWLLDSG